MNADSSSSGSDDRDAASWAEETLPLAVRRQLLERQLQELGFAKAVGHDWKAKLSLALYVVAMPLAFLSPWIAIAIYVASALMWFVPDRRIERNV